MCNTTGARVLAVMSVDGVNVVSGETASPSQSGYVLEARECTDINGWRKNLASINAFYFTELPDSYAARTGRPDNVGVIGVAFFRERPQPVAWKDAPAKLRGEPRRRAGRAAGGGAEATPPKVASDATREIAGRLGGRGIDAGAGRRRSAPATDANERSYVQTTRFERESATPNETIAINYDRRENLIAMGILPPPTIARSTNPFPAWTPRFVPAPPPR